jgi:hypothetical protein
MGCHREVTARKKDERGLKEREMLSLKPIRERNLRGQKAQESNASCFKRNILKQWVAAFSVGANR